jgi:hypothetical protein
MHMHDDHPARDLSGEIERLSRDGRHRPDEWLRFLVEDVLAGFGKRLATPWSAYHQERLFRLSGRYARLVAENPWRDILGGTYMELASHGQKQWLGQFFTPHPVATLMAEISFNDLDLERHPKDRLITVLEPAAGAGAMLLAVGRLITGRYGADALRRLSFTAIDLDGLCAGMTACQLLANAQFHGALGELVVYRGDALGPESDLDVVIHRLATPNPEQQGETQPLVLPAKAPERLAAIEVAARTQSVGQQLSFEWAEPATAEV